MNLEGYRGKKILLTGGMGFIGSTLAECLLKAGAQVIVVDNFLPDHGANWFNIEEFKNHPNLHVNVSDVLNQSAMRELCRDRDIVFHLGGQVSHVLSDRDPLPDINLNIEGTAIVLEVVRKYASAARLIYSGTRGQYGKQVTLPVTEDAQSQPTGIYELSNLTAERMIQIYHSKYGIPSVLLRLTNIYGPRAQIKHPHFGVLNWFVRLAVEKKPITIMGTGKIKRDFLYVDDCVRALLIAGISESVGRGEVINIGRDVPSTYLEAAEILCELSGSEIEYIEFSKERAAQEPGDFYSNIDRARALLGWEPTVRLEEGLRKHFHWLSTNLQRYT